MAPIRIRSAAFAFLSGAALLGAKLAVFAEGPPPGHTGGFGESTCQVCHAGAGVNEPPGGLTLEGVPAQYTPDHVYPLRVVVHRPGLVATGFQLAVRYAEGEGAGRQAGTLRARDSLAVVVVDSSAGPVAIQYAQHTLAGSRAAAIDTGRWTLEWRAPAPGRAAVFHVVANAANDDASPLGDFIYTTSRTTRAAPAGR